jgi:hypothetical protein
LGRKASVLLSLLVFLILLPAAGSAQENLPDWSQVTGNPYPLVPATTNPVLTADDVTDANALFVADPFLFHEGSTWYMFFEVLAARGKIGVATSSDGLQWTYDRLVLEEPWHLSFPDVFKWDGHYYMIPESEVQSAVYLYEASDFPYSWQRVATLVSGRNFVDPVVFHANGTWWMFVGKTGSCCCYLYYSDNLRSGWREHPRSPIVNNQWSRARPAGRSFVYDGTHILRLAQKNDDHYGEAVRAFQIDTLDRLQYAEHEIPQSPILQASGTGWNADGMHQCDAWYDGTRWIAAVDGLSSESWQIGIYQSASIIVSGVNDGSAGAEGLPGKVTLDLSNPFSPGGRIAYSLGEGTIAGSVRVQIFDVGGRLVRALLDGGGGVVDGYVTWDGTDHSGRPSANGSYLLRVSAEGTCGVRRFVLVR